MSAAVLSPHESCSAKQKPAAVFSPTCDALLDARGASKAFVMHRAGTKARHRAGTLVRYRPLAHSGAHQTYPGRHDDADDEARTHTAVDPLEPRATHTSPLA